MVAIPGDDELPITPEASAQRTWRTTAILAFAGLISLAALPAVAPSEVRRECRSVYGTPGGSGVGAIGGGGPLTAGQKCELRVGRLRISLPSWADAIVGRIVPTVEIAR
jgi:hypothetical protein